MLRAVVRKSSDSELEYIFDDKKINLAGTSGAPVLNVAGEVVAINLGGGEEGGRFVGMGNPCNSISNLLKAAIKP
jgi:S1-C subfamily serine protease